MNKFLLSVVFMAFLCTVSRAQNPTWQANEPILPKAYIGIGGGLENISGLIGVTGDLRVQKNFFLRAGAGLGSWGYKLGFGIRNEAKPGNSVGYGVTVTIATGLTDFTTEMEVASGDTKEVTMDLLQGYTITPNVSYKWVLRRGHRIVIEGGYAVPLQSDPWKIKDGSVLSETSKKVMKILQPGGLSLGAGLQFAL